MAKWLAGIIRFLVVLLILAVLGYNSIQIAALKAEVAALKAENERARSESRARNDEGQDEGAILTARRHMERAQSLLRQGRYAEAKREAQTATEIVRQATIDARDRGEDTLQGVRKEVDTLSRQAEALWKRHGGALGAPQH